MAYVGKKFPDLEVDAMNRRGKVYKINVLEQAINNKKKVVLFWFPKAFSYVCPTELHAFQLVLDEFKERNTIVIGASCDTPEVHLAWLNTAKFNGGIEGITFPILADTNRNLSRILGILDRTNERYDEATDTIQVDGDNVTYRATYIIDEEGIVIHESINPVPLGRNVNEFIRLIDAYTHIQEKGEVCPANWEEGKDAMKSSRDGVAEYLASH